MKKISCGLVLSVLLSASLPIHAQDDELAPAREAVKKRDYAAAAKLLQPWLDKDNPKAMVMMGKMRLAGQGVIKDEAVAVDLFKEGRGRRRAGSDLPVGAPTATGQWLAQG